MSLDANPLLSLLELSAQARRAAGADELAFLVVNDSHRLTPYRQAALWFADGGVRTLSGVLQIEANAPYVQWLERVCRWSEEAGEGDARSLTAADLPPEEGAEWAEWLPEYGLWLPFSPHHPSADRRSDQGGLLLAADQPWSEDSIALLREWLDVWHHAWLLHAPRRRWNWREWRQWRDRAVAWLTPLPDQPWWRQRRAQVAVAALVCLLFPVRLTVLAHGELVPANPAFIRAPLDGVIGEFHVQPNQQVKAGQPLFSFDEAAIAARLEVANEAFATAEVEYRQIAQQALTDSKFKAQLAVMLGKAEEKRAEAEYLRGQLERSRVQAPQDGIALFDDPSEWVGKPVQTGERIMRIAAPGDVEVEAWLPIADAIPVELEAPVSLYLAASPLSSLSARVRYFAHDAVARPDGSYAYRLRARLAQSTEQRVGLKGTAKVHGGWVPFIYWVLRRPLATIRQTLGV